MKRTTPHKSYEENTRNDVKNRFNELGFGLPYSYSFAKDLSNAYSHVLGGGCVTDSLLPIPSPVKTGNEAKDTQLQEQYKYDTNVQKFISELDFNAFTGLTPLQKAASIIQALTPEKTDNKNDGEGEDSEGTPLPIFTEGDSKAKAKQLSEDVENVKKAASNEVTKEFLGLTELAEKSTANLTKKQKAILAKLALLGDRGKIKSKRISANKSINQMADYSEVSSMANLTGMAMPTFGYKFATKQIQVAIKKQAAKQCLVLLVDDSGSMSDSEKIEWVTAILLDRIKAVDKGDAILYVAPFIYHAGEYVKITNRKEGLAMLKSFFDFNGGGTNVGEVVINLCNEIQKGKIGNHKLEGENPQIVVMNDGQDTVNHFVPTTTVNAFILGQDNKGLKNVVDSCKGHYERFM